MKKLLATFALTSILASFAILAAPVNLLAQSAPPLNYSGFVKCDGVLSIQSADPATGQKAGLKPGEEQRNRVCDFAALMDTFIKGINWLFYISVPVAVALFAYAGLLYMTGKSGNISTAKKIFSSVAIGFIIMISAWIGVRTIVGWLVNDNSGATTFLGK